MNSIEKVEKLLGIPPVSKYQKKVNAIMDQIERLKIELSQQVPKTDTDLIKDYPASQSHQRPTLNNNIEEGFKQAQRHLSKVLCDLEYWK